MNRRQVIQIGNALPPGVTASAFALAQLPSIAAWPLIAKGGVNAAKTGFNDRLERATVRMANGKQAIDGRFFDSSDGPATGFSVQDIQTGIVVPTFDTSGDFTIGVRFNPSSLVVAGGTWGGIACGSYSTANNAWRIENDPNGNLRMGAPGSLQSAYTDYAGPLLAANTITYLLLRFFRRTGTMNLRVNGVYEQNLQNEALKAAVFAAEVSFGLFWDFSAGAPRYRATQLLKAFAANEALVGNDLATAEAHLASPGNL